MHRYFCCLKPRGLMLVPLVLLEWIMARSGTILTPAGKVGYALFEFREILPQIA